MLPVEVNIPVPGSYISALDWGDVNVAAPPVIRTVPFCSNVAVWKARDICKLPVRAKLCDVGSYSSALFCAPRPPTMSTFPLGRRVAV